MGGNAAAHFAATGPHLDPGLRRGTITGQGVAKAEPPQLATGNPKAQPYPDEGRGPVATPFEICGTPATLPLPGHPHYD